MLALKQSNLEDSNILRCFSRVWFLFKVFRKQQPDGDDSTGITQNQLKNENNSKLLPKIASQQITDQLQQRKSFPKTSKHTVHLIELMTSARCLDGEGHLVLCTPVRLFIELLNLRDRGLR